jgi:hypothetical protein
VLDFRMAHSPVTAVDREVGFNAVVVCGHGRSVLSPHEIVDVV